MNGKITQDKTDILTSDVKSDIHRTEPSYTVNSETQDLNSTENKQIDSKIIQQYNLLSPSQKKEELLEEKKELLEREKLLIEKKKKLK